MSRSQWLPVVSILSVLGAIAAAEKGDGVNVKGDEKLASRDGRKLSAQPIGWRGDGSGVFPDARPPAKFSDGTTWSWQMLPDPRRPNSKHRVPVFTRDAANSKNIRWRTLLPNWSNASPIVVGGRVFTMCEPVGSQPLLVCLDSDTGRLLWRREIDHTSLLPPDEREKVRKEWKWFVQRGREVARLLAERWELHRRLKKAPKDAEALRALADWTTRAKAVNADKMDYAALKWGSVRAPGLLTREQEDRLKRLRNVYGLVFPNWETSLSRNKLQVGAYAGVTQPTPCSDGQSVFVFTGFNTAASFDLEGNLRWMRWLGPRGSVRGGGRMDFTQSPILVGDALLVASKAALTALDKDTGKVLWSVEPEEGDVRKAGGYDCLLMTGVVLEVDGETCFFWYDGRVYRVRDGKRLTDRLPGDETMYVPACPIASGDVLIYYSSHKSPNSRKGVMTATAVRLSSDGPDRLGATVLWRKPMEGEGQPRNGFAHDGKVVLVQSGKHSLRKGTPLDGRQKTGFRYDLETGKELDAMVLGVDHLSGVMRAGDRLVTLESLRNGHARIRVHALDGKLLGENYLSSAPVTPERLELIRGERGADHWHDDHYHGSFHAAPFFQGRRIYIRSRDELICIEGPPAESP